MILNHPCPTKLISWNTNDKEIEMLKLYIEVLSESKKRLAKILFTQKWESGETTDKIYHNLNKQVYNNLYFLTLARSEA